MSALIEPSDAEQASWNDTTREYVAGLQRELAEARAELVKARANSNWVDRGTHEATMRDLAEARTLVDGALPVVEIWGAQTIPHDPLAPAQMAWRRDWIDRARKAGASADHYASGKGDV